LVTYGASSVAAVCECLVTPALPHAGRLDDHERLDQEVPASPTPTDLHTSNGQGRPLGAPRLARMSLEGRQGSVPPDGLHVPCARTSPVLAAPSRAARVRLASKNPSGQHASPLRWPHASTLRAQHGHLQIHELEIGWLCAGVVLSPAVPHAEVSGTTA
jgi:hypothetical protein